jgi:hypothetical protein
MELRKKTHKVSMNWPNSIKCTQTMKFAKGRFPAHPANDVVGSAKKNHTSLAKLGLPILFWRVIQVNGS